MRCPSADGVMHGADLCCRSFHLYLRTLQPTGRTRGVGGTGHTVCDSAGPLRGQGIHPTGWLASKNDKTQNTVTIGAGHCCALTFGKREGCGDPRSSLLQYIEGLNDGKPQLAWTRQYIHSIPVHSGIAQCWGYCVPTCWTGATRDMLCAVSAPCTNLVHDSLCRKCAGRYGRC